MDIIIMQFTFLQPKRKITFSTKEAPNNNLRTVWMGSTGARKILQITNAGLIHMFWSLFSFRRYPTGNCINYLWRRACLSLAAWLFPSVCFFRLCLSVYNPLSVSAKLSLATYLSTFVILLSVFGCLPVSACLHVFVCLSLWFCFLSGLFCIRLHSRTTERQYSSIVLRKSDNTAKSQYSAIVLRKSDNTVL